MLPPAPNMSDHEMHDFLRRLDAGEYVLHIAANLGDDFPDGTRYFEYAGRTMTLRPLQPLENRRIKVKR